MFDIILPVVKNPSELSKQQKKEAGKAYKAIERQRKRHNEKNFALKARCVIKKK